jgi:hypothetical protein
MFYPRGGKIPSASPFSRGDLKSPFGKGYLGGFAVFHDKGLFTGKKINAPVYRRGIACQAPEPGGDIFLLFL